MTTYDNNLNINTIIVKSKEDLFLIIKINYVSRIKNFFDNSAE